MSLSRSGWLVGLVFLVACSDDSSPITFVDLSDGAVIGGPQMTRIDPDISTGALSVDLFLDDDRIGSAAAAPFVIEWNTVPFDEGDAELRARVYVADGKAIDGVIGIVIDNTPPEILRFPERLDSGTDVEVQVGDAHRIVHVEVAGPAGIAASWDEPPYRMSWDLEECGTSEVTVTAIDEAGWSTARTDMVETFFSGDLDCDGHEVATEAGGTDCNDEDTSIHPGAADNGVFGDINCDGVPGTDADGDGIAAANAGGRDCDDSDPAIHPRGYIYGERPLTIDGEPVTWEPGKASNIVVTYSTGGPPTYMFATLRSGVIELVTTRTSTGTTREALVEQVTPGKMALLKTANGDLNLIYTLGAQLRAVVDRGSGWTDELVQGFGSEIVHMAADVSGAPAAAVLDGTTVYLMTHDGKAWRSRVVETNAELSAAPISLTGIGIGGGTYLVTYVVGASLRQATVNVEGGDPTLVDLGTVNDPAGMLGLCASPDAAFHGEGGCVVRAGTPPQPVAICEPPVERLFCTSSGIVHFQTSSGVVGRYDSFEDSLEYLSVVADIASDRDGSGFQPVFARPGHYSTVETVIPPPDDPLDGVDRNCDGSD
jgi:hypothetical protein